MKVSFVKWRTGDAVECTVGKQTLLIGISAGPRIRSFTFNGGENILYEDNTGFGVGDWKMYGGHRFTTAPENEESYYPDNEPCKVSVEDSVVKIFAMPRPNGISLSLEITESLHEGFDINHVLLNKGPLHWEGALWAITCVPRSARLLASCETGNIHFWPGTDASKWNRVNGVLTVEDGGFRGKAGWYSTCPKLVSISKQGKLIISSPVLSDPALCVDDGSNAEIFVCAEHAELETLSEKFLVPGGGSVFHQQHWQFHPSPEE